MMRCEGASGEGAGRSGRFDPLLDEEDEVPFGIVHAEDPVLERLDDRDRVSLEVALQRCNVARGEGHSLHTRRRRR